VIGVTVVAVAQRDGEVAPSAQSEPIDLPQGEFDNVSGISSFTTPIAGHYIIDTANQRPRVERNSYALTIGGPFAKTHLRPPTTSC